MDSYSAQGNMSGSTRGPIIILVLSLLIMVILSQGAMTMGVVDDLNLNRSIMEEPLLYSASSNIVPLLYENEQLGIIFRDGFENVSNGDYPSLKGWNVLFGGTGAYVSNESSYEGNSSFKLIGQASWARMDYLKISPPSQLSYEYYITLPSLNDALGGFAVKRGSSGPIWNAVYFHRQGGLYFIGTRQNFLQNYTAVQWYKVHVDLDYNSETAEVYIDDILVGNDLDIMPREFDAGGSYGWVVLDQFTLTEGGYGYANGPVYYDNVLLINSSKLYDAVVNKSSPACAYGPTFTNIQSAVNYVPVNGTVYVCNGTYHENVDINKSINLVGSGADVTTINASNSSAHVMDIKAAGVNVSGFTVRGANSYFPSSGIYLRDAWFNNISKNVLYDNLVGIYVDSSSYNIISDNTLKSNFFGFHIEKSSDNDLTNNIVMSNTIGINVSVSTNTTLNNNTFRENNDTGILLMGSSYNSLIRNIVQNNSGNGGIWLAFSSNHNEIINNSATDNHLGIRLTYANNNTILSNSLGWNTDFGIRSENTINNTIYHNNFINNTNQSYDDGNNTWDNGYAGGGNYWSDFDSPAEGCNDSNSDGVCDSPYDIIGGSNKDKYPVTSTDGWQNITPSTKFPTITIYSPLNITYNASTVDLNYSINSPDLDWVGYSLDGEGNVSLVRVNNISQNIGAFNSRFNNYPWIAQTVRVAEERVFVKNIELFIETTLGPPLTNLTVGLMYAPNGIPNGTIISSTSKNYTDISANSWNTFAVSHSLKGNTSYAIFATSENNTVLNSYILKIDVNDSYPGGKWCHNNTGYWNCVDWDLRFRINYQNYFNATFSGLNNGQHNLTVYANDSQGNTNSSTVWFTVDAYIRSLLAARHLQDMKDAALLIPGTNISLGLQSTNLSEGGFFAIIDGDGNYSTPDPIHNFQPAPDIYNGMEFSIIGNVTIVVLDVYPEQDFINIEIRSAGTPYLLNGSKTLLDSEIVGPGKMTWLLLDGSDYKIGMLRYNNSLNRSIFQLIQNDTVLNHFPSENLTVGGHIELLGNYSMVVTDLGPDYISLNITSFGTPYTAFGDEITLASYEQTQGALDNAVPIPTSPDIKLFLQNLTHSPIQVSGKFGVVEGGVVSKYEFRTNTTPPYLAVGSDIELLSSPPTIVKEIGADYVTLKLSPLLLAPSIKWEPPTPDDDATVNENQVYLNTTITATSDTSAFFDWNNTLVGYWSMDYYNASGIHDNSTYNNFGTFSGGLGQANITQGKYGSALEFDGIDDTIIIDKTTFDGIINLTTSLWVKFNELSRRQKMVSALKSGNLHYFTLEYESAGNIIQVVFDTGINCKFSTQVSLNPSQWYHIAFTKKLGRASLYLNGVEVNRSITPCSGPISKNTGDTRIGSGNKNINFLNGSLDEVLIFSRVLSEEEINASYNNGLYRLHHNFTGLEDGAHSYATYAMDSDGNLNITDYRTVTVDTTVPVYGTSYLGYDRNKRFDVVLQKSAEAASGSWLKYDRDPWNDFLYRSVMVSAVGSNVEFTYYVDDIDDSSFTTAPGAPTLGDDVVRALTNGSDWLGRWLVTDGLTPLSQNFGIKPNQANNSEDYGVWFDATGDGDVNDADDYPVYNDVLVVNRTINEITLRPAMRIGNASYLERRVFKLKGQKYYVKYFDQVLDRIKLVPVSEKTLISTATTQDCLDAALLIPGTDIKVCLQDLTGVPSGKFAIIEGGVVTSYKYRDNTTSPLFEIGTDLELLSDFYFIPTLINPVNQFINVAIGKKTDEFTVYDGDTNVLGYSEAVVNDDNDWTGVNDNEFRLEDSSISIPRDNYAQLASTFTYAEYNADKEFDLVQRRVKAAASGSRLKYTKDPWDDFLLMDVTAWVEGGNVRFTYYVQDLDDNISTVFNGGFGGDDVENAPTSYSWDGNWTVTGLSDLYSIGEINLSSDFDIRQNQLNNTASYGVWYDATGDGDVGDPEDYPIYNDFYIVDRTLSDLTFRPAMRVGNASNMNRRIFKLLGQSYLVTDYNDSASQISLVPVIEEVLPSANNTLDMLSKAIPIPGTDIKIGANNLTFSGGVIQVKFGIIEGGVVIAYYYRDNSSTTPRLQPGVDQEVLSGFYVVPTEINVSGGYIELAFGNKSLELTISDGETGVLGYPRARVNVDTDGWSDEFRLEGDVLKAMKDSYVPLPIPSPPSYTAPKIWSGPDSINITLLQDEVARVNLTIGNDGYSALEWNATVRGLAHSSVLAMGYSNISSEAPLAPYEIPMAEGVPGEFFIKPAEEAETLEMERLYASMNASLLKRYGWIGYDLIKVGNMSLEDLVKGLNYTGLVEVVEPNYIVKAIETGFIKTSSVAPSGGSGGGGGGSGGSGALPNDPRFKDLWGMHNTGQTGGTVDADIDAPAAWDISTGNRDVVVAVIDTGVDYTHEDLVDNIWTNPGETPGNGVDDDGNGFIDDYYGWDFAYNDNDPMDGNSHGTHCSGTIGGVGGNGKGVAGVSWKVRIMAVKFLSDSGYGSTSDAIDAVDYARMMGADIMSNSWGGGGYSSALEAAIQAADDEGILFVAAAGNDGRDNDLYPHYPSSYNTPNVLAVAATDHNDLLAGFSNYGSGSVDLGAPGVSILSTVPGNGYSYKSGTSMATPHTAGAAALLKAYEPGLSHHEIKGILLNSSDPVASLQGKTVSGGRLNLYRALLMATPGWIEVDPFNGSIPPGNFINITVEINASGMKNGSYHAGIHINSNDPDGSPLIVPVNLNVLDITPPEITLHSPLNTTYNLSLVPLLFSTNEDLSWIGYGLDGDPVINITGNITLSNLSNGHHNLTLYAIDLGGNQNQTTVWFTVQSPDIYVTPDHINATLLQRSWTNRTLIIGNDGVGPLYYNLSTEFVTAVIIDPAGDDINNVPVDIIRVEGSSTSHETSIKVIFNHTFDKANTVGFISLDTDQDSSTGIPPSFGSSGQDIGADYEAYLFNMPSTGNISIIDRNTGLTTAEVPALFGTDYFSFSIPLTALGNDDGIMDVTMVLGDLWGPTDWAPDNGHGTIRGGTGWLSLDSYGGVLPAGDSTNISVLINSTTLNNGSYTSKIQIDSNDLDETPYIIPVSIDVIDMIPPHITLHSPLNTTYYSSTVKLQYTVNEDTSWMGFSLDGNPIINISGNTSLTNLSNGPHNITVHASDMGGNSNNLSRWFTVSLPDIWISPIEVNITLRPNSSGSKKLVIGNDGPGPLYFNLSARIGPINQRILVDNGHGNTGHPVYYSYLESLGYTVNYTSGPITPELLNAYSAFITVQAYSYFSQPELDALKGFVVGGGGLLVIGDDNPDIYETLTGYAGINWSYSGGYGGETANLYPHELTENTTSLYFGAPVSSLEAYHPALPVANDSANKTLQVAAAQYGSGRIVALVDEQCLMSSYLDQADNRQFGRNIMEWLTGSTEWLSLSDMNGTVQPNESASITLIANSTGLEYGTYESIIHLTSNDPDDTPVEIPINLYVSNDSSAPIITVHSPLNTTYYSSKVLLNVSGDEPIDTWWYSLDEGPDQTFIPPVNISGLSEGRHSLIVYANDSIGNLGSFGLQVGVPPTQLWNRIFDSGGSGYPNGAIVDGGDNVVVAGSSYSGGDSDFLIVKYDSNGSLLWNTTYDSGGYDHVVGLATDGDDNVIVAGGSYIGGDNDYMVLKYNPLGKLLWNRTYDVGSWDDLKGLAVDKAGNVIVTGNSQIGGDNDYYTIKYDSNGTLLWNMSYDTGNSDYPVALEIDGNDSVIIAGHSYLGGDWDYFTIKYDSNGTLLWNTTYDTGNSDYISDLSIDKDDNVILAGDSYNGIDYDYSIIKYESNGTLWWNRTYDGGSWDDLRGLVVDQTGNVVAVGLTEHDGDYDYLTLKYDPLGSLLWNRTYDGGSWESANDVNIDGMDNIYVTGYPLIIKYSSEGSPIWNLPAIGNMTLDSENNIYLVKDYFNGTSDSINLTKYSQPSGPLYFSVNLSHKPTPAGENITLSYPELGVSITFDNVTEPGMTVVNRSKTNPGGKVPSSYKVAKWYYNLITYANYTGNITICIYGFDVKPGYKLFHWTGTGWRDITTVVDADADFVCGVSEGLSPFSVLFKSSSGGGSGGGGGGGGSGGGGGAGGGGSVVTSIFEGRGVLTEDELIEIMTLLGHDFGPKSAFNRFMAPLASLYSARDRIVMSLDMAARLLDSVKLADLGLEKMEYGNIYEENARYILEHYPGGDTLIVARGDKEFDSLITAPLSDLLGAPILLVDPGAIPEAAMDVFTRREYQRIYIIGGEEAISTSVEDEIRFFAREVKRLGGETRYETSVEVAKEVLAEGGNPMPITTSGRDPVLYTATLANKYRSPIIYIDKPPVKESTFKNHDIVEGSLSVEGFTTWQAIGDKTPIYRAELDVDADKITDAWMYIQTIGYDSVAEKWKVKLNGYTLAYNIHSSPVAEHKRSQLTRFDVGDYLIKGSNELVIEGTNFNLDDQFFITGVTLVILEDTGEKTEYWISEGDGIFQRSGSFEEAESSTLYALYLEQDHPGEIEFNNAMVALHKTGVKQLRVAPPYTTLVEASVTDHVTADNHIQDSKPSLAVLRVESNDLSPAPVEHYIEPDPNQRYVMDYINQEKFEQVGMVYYKDSLG